MSDSPPLPLIDLMSEDELLPTDAPPRTSVGLTGRVVRGSLWNLGGQGATLLATLIATPFVIRLLGAEGYGLLALVNIFIGLSFADMGMGWASTRFGSDAHALDDDEREATVVWTALLLAAGPSLLIALMVFLGARTLVVQGLHLPDHLQETAILALRLGAFGFTGRALAGVLNTPEVVRLRMDLLVLINSGTLIGQIFLVPLVLYLGGGLIGAVSVIAGAAIVSALLHAFAGVRLLSALRRPRVNLELMRPLARFGGAMVITALAIMMLANADKILLTRYSSVQAVAYYAVALNLSTMLSQAPMAMVQSLLPAFSQLQANPDRTNLHELYQRAVRGTLLWVGPSAVLICVVARPFFTKWAGPEFGRESTMLLYILAVGVVFEAMAYVPCTLLIAMGRTDLVARCHGGVLLPYLLLAALAINWFGAPGAAVVWSLRSLVSTIAFALIARRLTGFAFAPLPANVKGYLAAMAILILPVVSVCMLSSSALVRLGITLIALGVHAVFILNWVLRPEERAWILHLVPIGYWRHLPQKS